MDTAKPASPESEYNQPADHDMSEAMAAAIATELGEMGLIEGDVPAYVDQPLPFPGPPDLDATNHAGAATSAAHTVAPSFVAARAQSGNMRGALVWGVAAVAIVLPLVVLIGGIASLRNEPKTATRPAWENDTLVVPAPNADVERPASKPSSHTVPAVAPPQDARPPVRQSDLLTAPAKRARPDSPEPDASLTWLDRLGEELRRPTASEPQPKSERPPAPREHSKRNRETVEQASLQDIQGAPVSNPASASTPVARPRSVVGTEHNSAEFHTERALRHFSQRNLGQAIADLTKAIEIAPHQAKPYHHRGVIWTMRGEFDRAIHDFDAALRLDPSYTIARVYREVVIEKKQEQALASYRQDERKALPTPRQREGGDHNLMDSHREYYRRRAEAKRAAGSP